jgi:hypothetical protein
MSALDGAQPAAVVSGRPGRPAASRRRAADGCGCQRSDATERHFLCLSDDPQRKHEVEITIPDARAMDLVPCGEFDSGEILETYWVPRGDPASDPEFSRFPRI